MSVQGKTVREFQTDLDVWDIADKWAGTKGYTLVGQDQASRLYQRGTGLWSIPQMVQISVIPGGYVLLAWVHAPTVNRVLSLGMLPEEMVLEKGGFVGVVPRNRARGDVNELLAALGVETIQ